MGLYDALFGSPQALYAGYAILAAIIVIIITIVLTRTDLSVGNRFLFIFLVILMLIPSVFLTLLQLTCMVTGGTKDQRWWCWLYAWIVSIFIIIYCIFVIIIAFMSLFTYTNAINKVDIQEKMSVMNVNDSNEYAKSMMLEGFTTNDKEEKEVKTSIQTPTQTTTSTSTPTPTQITTSSVTTNNGTNTELAKFTNQNESVSVNSSQTDLNELKGGLDDEELEPFTNKYTNYSRY